MRERKYDFQRVVFENINSIKKCPDSEIATAIGMSKQQYHQVKNCKQMLNVDDLAGIAKHLNVKVERLTQQV